MSEHAATIEWKRTTPDFSYATYTRDHVWRFGGGISVEASAAPAYKGNPALVDPEEAFVASLSSCHMLTFLALCTKERLVVDRYVDHAVGHLEKRADGRLCMARVVLRPRIEFGGDGPPPELLARLHHDAHEACFIANSVTTEVTAEEDGAGG